MRASGPAACRASSGRGRSPGSTTWPVWSILCFNVRVGYRRRGVAAALLDGVIDLRPAVGRARASRPTRSIPEGGRVDVGFGYVGVTPMFETAGFRRVVETDGPQRPPAALADAPRLHVTIAARLANPARRETPIRFRSSPSPA